MSGATQQQPGPTHLWFVALASTDAGLSDKGQS